MADHAGPSSGAVLLGFLSGAALGAVMAILLTPRSGQESREMLRGYARRAEDGLRDLVGEAGETFEGVVEEGRGFLRSQKTVLREAFDAGREAMRRERDQLNRREQGEQG